MSITCQFLQIKRNLNATAFHKKAQKVMCTRSIRLEIISTNYVHNQLMSRLNLPPFLVPWAGNSSIYSLPRLV